jgi:hypothetical protein
MPYTNPRGLPIADMGTTIVALCACTLADYSGGGTQTPLVDDLVTWSATGDFYVKRAGNHATGPYGRVTKVEVAPTGTAVGYIAVEWLDVDRFVRLDVSNLANATRGNRCQKAGADTVAHDWDATAATGSNLLCVAKSAATGAGFVCAAVLARDS